MKGGSYGRKLQLGLLCSGLWNLCYRSRVCIEHFKKLVKLKRQLQAAEKYLAGDDGVMLIQIEVSKGS